MTDYNQIIQELYMTILPRYHHFTSILIGILTFSSCIPHKRLVNFQEHTDLFSLPDSIQVFSRVTIQPNDQLFIQVSTLDEEASQPFNQNIQNLGGAMQAGQFLAGYLVDSKGFIEYPQLGKIKLGGLDREAATAKIVDLLSPFLESPRVKVGIVNFKVTVFGEVQNPGVLRVSNERFTIVEALAQAGFTPYSVREKVWVIREENNKRVFGKVNFYSREVFNSPYFQLRQNDVIYVEPTKDVVTNMRQPILAVIPWISSVIGLGTTIYLLFFNENNNN